MAGMQQTQNLSMQQTLAPQLQQSLQILQAPVLELRNLIQAELAVNPVLEEIPSEPTLEDRQQAADDFQKEFEHLARLDDEWRDYMSQTSAYARRSQEEEERRQFLLDSLASTKTLQQHLLEQLQTSDLSGTQRKIGELIIGNIDERGFLQVSVEEMSRNTGLDAGEIAHVLEMIQRFHPVGVGARDLRECLLVQLQRLDKTQSLEFQIVDHCLEALGKRRFPEIARQLGVTPEQVQKAADFISTLDPKPGQLFTPEVTRYIQPDVTVQRLSSIESDAGGNDEAHTSNGWQVILNGEQIPRLRISNTYKDLMAQTGEPTEPASEAQNGARSGTQSEEKKNEEKSRARDEVRDYIREKIRSGKFLIKSIHQRQETIARIAHQIVERQQLFFEQGPAALRPLTMQQVAESVGVHETTVGRAISGKYMATPWGVFEMKYFFTPGYQTAAGEALSNTSVKNAIVELIRAEDKKHPLSDKELVEILTERGIPIARRTVAKYRIEAGILPGNLRKSY